MIRTGMTALFCCAIFFSTIIATAQSKKANTMKKKILFVVTSHDRKGNTGLPTGYYLSEVSHAWRVLKDAGYEIDFVSPKGGEPPVDGFDLTDPDNKAFWEDEYYHNKISHSYKPAQVKPEEYAAIYYAGGHGAVWDLPDNEEIAKIAARIYENNGIISAVCHGPAGIVNIKLSNGKYLIEGKKVNGFTNEEEAAVKLDQIVPFLLEDKLIQRGGVYEKSGPWQQHVVTDGRLVTGQNPQSAHAVGKSVLDLLSK
jgi:putative intracellular protease/amidase